MTEPDVLAIDAFLDVLNDTEFDGPELYELEEYFEVSMPGLEEWMLP
ncbi:hypothetical protein [Kitasatospora aureofaciens]